MSSTVIHAARIVTCDERWITNDDPLGTLEDAAMVVENGLVAWIGRRVDCPAADVPIEARDAVVLPGLCDAHTHAVWAGSRHGEYAMRLAGRDYREIAAAGGGIVSTHRAVAAASEDDLARELRARLMRMVTLGVTACEVKSGYGLEPEHELKQLRAIRLAVESEGELLPRVVPTFLALHAVPPSATNRADYIARATELVDQVAAEKLAHYVDAYVDGNAFSVEEARPVLTAARRCGLPVRLHVGQFADIGGAELAAEFGAHSVDHVEHIGEAGIAALAAAGTSVGLLPTASFTLAQVPPPVAAFRAAGIPMFVASDANPGTAPTESLPLAVAIGARLYGLTPEEAILGATRVAARSLGLAGAGTLAVGAPADLAVWNLPHELALLQPWGVSRVRFVMRGGSTLFYGHAQAPR